MSSEENASEVNSMCNPKVIMYCIFEYCLHEMRYYVIENTEINIIKIHKLVSLHQGMKRLKTTPREKNNF